MQLTESSIFINLKALRRRLYTAQFMMTKADRIIYGTPLMESCGKALGEFILAFLVKEDKVVHLENCIAHFTVLRVDLEFCADENLIKFPKRKPKPGEPEFADSRDEVSAQKIEMFRLVAKIDEDMCKWRAGLAKGKTSRDMSARQSDG